MTGRSALLQFWVAVSSFQDQLCIEKPINTLEDELDLSIVETWDLISVSVNVCDLWKDFFAADASMKVSQFVTPSILKTLEEYVDSILLADFQNMTSFEMDLIATCRGVKCIIIALNDILGVLKREDFPAFMKHPIGQKLMARINGGSSSNPLRFLRNPRSPERDLTSPISPTTIRLSMDSDRGGITSGDEDSADISGVTQKKKRSSSVLILGNTIKMIERMGNSIKNRGEKLIPIIGEQSTSHSPPILQENTSMNVEGELTGIINSEENSFIPARLNVSIDRKRHNRSPVESQKGNLAASGKAFLESFRKGHVRSNSFGRDKGKGSGLSDNLIVSPKEDDASFIKLEMEDQQPASFDDDLSMEPHSSAEQTALPPMIILPKRFFELDVTLDSLQKDYDAVEPQIRESEKSNDHGKIKSLNYTKRGIWHEMQDIRAEKQKIEVSELENVIMSVNRLIVNLICNY